MQLRYIDMMSLCRKISELKKKVDEELGMLVQQGVAVSGASRVSMHPSNFMTRILPFYHNDLIVNNGSTALYPKVTVDPSLVVGGTYRNYRGVSVSRQYLNDINLNSSNDIDRPIYHKVGDFPLYIAWEGKNRVEIFREAELPIVCDLKHTTYPSADDLVIHKALFAKGVYFLTCNDKKFIHRQNNCEQIYFPEYIVPLLKEYGVKEGKPVFKLFSTKSRKRVLVELSTSIMRN